MVTKEQAAEVSRLTDEVLQLVDDADISKAQKILTQARKVDAQSPLLYKLELYCCLQEHRWKETLRLIQKYRDANEKKASPESKRIDTRFEESYAHYKLNQLQKAMHTLQPNGSALAGEGLSTTQGLLASQILYRRGKYSEALAIIQRVLKEEGADVDEYLEMNMHAALNGVCETEAFDKKSLPVSIETADKDEEAVFNAATLALNSGELHRAESYFSKLKNTDQGDANLAATIAVQRAYLAGLLSDTDAAVEVYRRHTKSADAITVAVSMNNLAVHTNSYTPKTVDGLKLMSVSENINFQDRMSHSQYVIVTVNEVLAMAKNGRVSMAKDATSMLASKLRSEGHGDDPRVSFCRAVTAFADGRLSPCMIGLVACFKSLPDGGALKPNSLTKDAVLLMLVKLAISHKALPLAADCLSYLEPTAFSANPLRGHIAVMLLSNSKHKARAVDVGMLFTQAPPKNLSADDEAALVSLLVSAGNVAIALGRHESGYTLFSYVVTHVNSSHLSSLAGLLKTAPQSKRTEILSRLTAALQPAFIKHDGEALEASVISIEALQKAERRGVKRQATQKRKLRPSRIPKSYDPENPPKLNPERWVPKMERTDNKKKKFATAQGVVPAAGSKQHRQGPSTARTILPEDKSVRRQRK